MIPRQNFRPHWYKFFDPSIANLGESTLNYPVLRYSDLLITYAEALNELNGSSAEVYEAGTLTAKGNEVVKEYHNLFPLPQRELDVNKSLTQNLGYTL